jgi:ankyrin repeat protein
MVVMNESTKLFFDSMDTAKRSELKEKDEEGNTPLHWACFFGQLDVVRLLINNGILFYCFFFCLFLFCFELVVNCITVLIIILSMIVNYQ